MTSQHLSVSEQVAGVLRAYILRMGLAPGERLGREEDLVRTFGVSRPTMREALRLLASSGLVRTSKGPGGGIFVAGTIEQGVARVVTDSVAVLLSASPDLDALLEARGIV